MLRRQRRSYDNPDSRVARCIPSVGSAPTSCEDGEFGHVHPFYSHDSTLHLITLPGRAGGREIIRSGAGAYDATSAHSSSPSHDSIRNPASPPACLGSQSHARDEAIHPPTPDASAVHTTAPTTTVPTSLALCPYRLQYLAFLPVPRTLHPRQSTVPACLCPFAFPLPTLILQSSCPRIMIPTRTPLPSSFSLTLSFFSACTASPIASVPFSPPRPSLHQFPSCLDRRHHPPPPPVS
nr:hypothetical protein CFP56_01149 [Quercus suber]